MWLIWVPEDELSISMHEHDENREQWHKRPPSPSPSPSPSAEDEELQNCCKQAVCPPIILLHYLMLNKLLS